VLAGSASACVFAVASTTGKIHAEAPLRCGGTSISCLNQQAKAGSYASTFIEDSTECFHLLYLDVCHCFLEYVPMLTCTMVSRR
jgi:hypothetical protein